MRIFLTGASGLVGSAFARASARRGHTVTGIVGNFLGDVPGLSSRRPLDLTDESTLSAALLEDQRVWRSIWLHYWACLKPGHKPWRNNSPNCRFRRPARIGV